MPRRDRTGPEGKGPKTGRGLGPCDDKDTKQSDRPRRGRRNRRPWGKGKMDSRGEGDGDA